MRRFAQYVLPKIDKFLESPEEKRLRRLRSGMITALIGLAIGLPAVAGIAASHDRDFILFLGYVAVFAAVTFATGLGLLLNGLLFSRPRKGIEDRSSEAQLQNLLDREYVAPPLRSSAEGQPGLHAQTTSDLSRAGSSITEHTTHHLKTER